MDALRDMLREAAQRHGDEALVLGAALAAAVLLIASFLLTTRALATGLLQKELKHFFYSPIAWLTLTAFAVVNGYVYVFLVDHYARAQATVPFATQYFSRNFYLWVPLLVIIPAITMRLLAEEKATGTIETLMTAPVRDVEVVYAKFAAALVFYVVLWLPNLPLTAALYWHGLPPGAWDTLMADRAAHGWTLFDTAAHAIARLKEVMDMGPFLAAYLGLFLLGASWIAIGLLASSFAVNQVVAFMASFVTLLVLFAIGFVEQLVPVGAHGDSALRQAIREVSVLNQFEKFPLGIIDTRSCVYFLSLTIVALFLCVRVVESRKWR